MATPTGSDRISAVRPNELAEAAGTPGLVRKVAFDTERGMLIRASCEGHMVSGWHHHGDREVLGHVLRGRVRLEFGPGGTQSTDVEEGGYFHVPSGLVHRDVNPDDEPQDLLISFVGTGPLVFNLDGPAS
jgi:quercetin dioxygenase-like cupin family protein